MKNVALPLVVASAIHSVSLAAPTGQEESFDKRLENGLGRTPALGYNNWVAESFPC
jgi:alpha-galactosidase